MNRTKATKIAPRAMLLCAGLGTRLGSLAEVWPKPLLPMGDVPIVRYSIALLAGHGISDIVINTHYKPMLFHDTIGDGSDFGVRIHYSHEPTILGTGGGVRNALELLDPTDADAPIVVMNGKLVVDADVTGVIRTFEDAGPDTLGAMVVRRAPADADFGRVDVDERGRVRNILAEGDYMFCGVHVTRPSVMRSLPDGETCSIRQGYLPWLRTGRGRIMAVEHTGYFAEHSTPERYREGNLALVRGAVLQHPPAPTTGIAPTAQIARDARIHPPVRISAGACIEAGAVVTESVIGAGAVIAQGAHVRRSVVWPRARASGTVVDTIVTSMS